ncbi:MAG: hypothetical protein K5925_01210 [Bacilli bacterium]|nr:hypothetical protein [Bacilli bacterium]
MKKSERQVEVLIESLIECANIEKVIEALPRGYISVKKISGHTYYYRQWREGDKIISTYVPESYLKVIRQKIEIRKQNEELLKILKKDAKKAERDVLKAGEVSQEQIDQAKEKINSLSEEDLENREAIVNSLKAELLA